MKKLFAIVLAVCLFCAPLMASDYTIPSYYMHITVNRDAVLHMEEGISAYFNVPLHGIYREIPVGYYNGQRAVLSNVKGNRYFELYESDRSYRRYRFGTEDQTFTGSQEYVLTYDYDIGADQNEGYDELYYNLVGEGWQVPLEKAYFAVDFPSEIDTAKVWLTRGQYGSTSSEGTEVWFSDDRKTVYVYAEDMVPGEELTIRVELPDGYYVGAREIVNKTPLYFWLTVVSCLVVLALAALIWLRHGKDQVPVFYASSTPPEGMSPLLMGYLADGQVDDKDITSMLFYWADKDLLEINPVEGKKDRFTFQKLRDIPSDALPLERYLFDSFFKCGTDGLVTEKDLSEDFYEKMQKTKEKVAAYFKGKRKLTETKSELFQVADIFLGLVPAILTAMCLTWDYVSFETMALVVLCFGFELIQFLIFYVIQQRWYVMKMNPRIAMGIGCIPAVLMLLMVFAINALSQTLALQMTASMLTVVTLAIMALFASITKKRSDYGQKTLEAVLGYREFIDKVEMDKLKMMIDSDPEFYYHNLSYAIVLGLEDKWAKKFAGIKMQPPRWYRGNDLVFDAIFYSHMARNWNTRMHTVVMPKSTSGRSSGTRFGGSSFGGSGFSGGGFGGGGGGAW